MFDAAFIRDSQLIVFPRNFVKLLLLNFVDVIVFAVYLQQILYLNSRNNHNLPPYFFLLSIFAEKTKGLNAPGNQLY
jgi:lipid-A-disaccharide synthase-like uncharacterized protein